jgi:hypothetical protein
MPSKHLSCIAGLFCTYDTLLDCLHGNLHGNSCVHKKMLLVEDCRSLFVSLLYRFFLLFCLFDLLRLYSFSFPCIAFFPIYAYNLLDEMTFRIISLNSYMFNLSFQYFTWYQSTSDFFSLMASVVPSSSSSSFNEDPSSPYHLHNGDSPGSILVSLP